MDKHYYITTCTFPSHVYNYYVHSQVYHYIKNDAQIDSYVHLHAISFTVHSERTECLMICLDSSTFMIGYAGYEDFPYNIQTARDQSNYSIPVLIYSRSTFTLYVRVCDLILLIKTSCDLLFTVI